MSKLLFFILLCLFVIVGCHAVNNSVNDYNACLNDSICRAKMLEYGNFSANLVRSSGVSNNLFESIAYNLASALTGILLGRKLRKRSS